MRVSTAALLASLAVLAPAAAFGQVATGNEVSVNPVPGGTGQTLLYPGGQYMRVVPPLLQPGQKPADNGAIALHMPGKAPVRTARTAPSQPRETSQPRQAVETAAPRPAPRRVAVAAPPPPPKPAPEKAAPARSAPADNGFNPGMPGAGAAGLNLGALPTMPSTQPQTARKEPAPANVEPSAPGLSKRSVILFAAESSDPAQSALGSIKFLAGDLNTAMTGPGSRVQLIAYGGATGDKGSDARRLSLKRALAIRQVLIDDGVPSERIDVRAMGGADDGGPADRVDVYVKA